ncbi:hypothetical protein CL655_02235 [bacterium]|nr:hypothetical protein [bacterium]|tara:strand:- start:8627 stop:9292 length:666 start_codon:yes stop_codon:yes gene_type:complete
MDRLDAYNQLPGKLKPLYEGTDDRLSVLDEVFTALNVPKDKQKVLINAFGDVVLGIEPADSFSTTLQTFLTPDEATIVTEKFSPLLTFIAQTHATPHAGGDTPNHKREAPESETLEQTTVEPMHTMANDMQKVHGYGALAVGEETEASDEPVYKTEQTNVLERPNVANLPQYDSGGEVSAVDTSTSTPERSPAPAPVDTRWQSDLTDAPTPLDKPEAETER